jgi:hypothetical protein
VEENLPKDLDLLRDDPVALPPGASDKERKDASDRQLETIIRQVMQLRQDAVNNLVSQMRFLQTNQEKQLEEDELAAQQSQLIGLIKTRGLLDKALAKPMILD